MKDATKRTIVRWIHIVFSIPILGYIVRLNNFQCTPPVFGLSLFLSWSFRDFGCGKAISFDGFFRRGRPYKTLQQTAVTQ